MQSSHLSSHDKVGSKWPNVSTSDDGFQSMLVNIDVAKQSLLQNPQLVNNPNLYMNSSNCNSTSNLSRILGTEAANQSHQLIQGLNLHFPQQPDGLREQQQQQQQQQQLVHNLNGNDHSNGISSFPFYLDPSTLHSNKNLQQGSFENNTIYDQLQLKSMLYNIQPNQMLLGGLNQHTQWNNYESETGIKRTFDQMSMNASSMITTEEEQSYKAVSATSSSGASVGFLPNKNRTGQLQTHSNVGITTNLLKEKEEAVSEKNTAISRRNERNQREQERARRINQQIKALRSVLNESNVTYKQNKYSILVSVVDYIKQLQSRSLQAEKEQKQVLKTIKVAIDTAKNDGFVHRSDSDIDIGNDTTMLRVKGLDYRLVFEQCKLPLAVAAIDGRFLLYNHQFEAMTGLDKHRIDDKTIFDFIPGSETEAFFTDISNSMDETSCKRIKSTISTEQSIDDQQTTSGEDENISGDGSGEKDRDGCSGGDNSARKSESTISSANGSDGSRYDGQSQSQTSQSIKFWSSPLSRPNENVSANVAFSYA